jgi:16S rRNA C1402 N4-methylase RsmH
LEREIVQNFANKNAEGLEVLTKDPVTANESELRENPRARSAKLFAYRKK